MAKTLGYPYKTTLLQVNSVAQFPIAVGGSLQKRGRPTQVRHRGGRSPLLEECGHHLKLLEIV